VESTGAYRSTTDAMADYKFGYSSPIFSPTGGVKISAYDLAKYMIMHMNYGEYGGVRIISEQSAKLMQTPVSSSGYGLCLTEFDDKVEDEKYKASGNYLIGHTGGAYGLSSIMIWSPAEGWGIVAMTNGCTSVKGKNFLNELTNAIYQACIAEK
jgi:CubicO group peptidase (beta-lactamase class C family)